MKWMVNGEFDKWSWCEGCMMIAFHIVIIEV